MSFLRYAILAVATLPIAAALAQPTPYVRTAPALKPNTVGIYPKLQNAKQWNGNEAGQYSIKFKVKGIKPGDTVYLADYHLDGKFLRDTTVVDKKGVANFTGRFKLQRGMYLFVLPQKQDYFEFLIDDDQDFTISTDTALWTRDYYKNMAVDGSDENTGFLSYQLGKTNLITRLMKVDEKMKTDTLPDQKAALQKERTQILADKENYDKDYIKAHPNRLLSRFLWSMVDIEVPTELPKKPDGTTDSSFQYRYYKLHYWDHVDLNEDGLTRMPLNIIKQKLDFFFDKVMLPDADSNIVECDKLLARASSSIEIEKYLIWYLTNRFESSNIMGLDKVFVHMANNYYCSGKAWWVDSATIARMCENSFRRAKCTIGSPGAPLELQTRDGQWFNTASINAPYTILIFWDPTCGHCKEVLPKLLKIYENNKAKGWKVVALASGDRKKEWLEYLKEHPEMNEFIHLIRGEVRSQEMADNLYNYYVVASPTIFILDENKTIRANRIDVEKIEEYLGHLDRFKAAKAKENNGTGNGNTKPGTLIKTKNSPK
ncbi:MAG: DUF5106 domain-containing protein [Bacteroidetes bacterium]|nr:DUF5106 domain-containing protein [Bacteroidota bacterium]